MKLGYSILLGEYVEATRIEYRDCESFQIVCPACYEPVFKVIRADNEATIEYLSHYAIEKSYQTDCELRVRGISPSECERSNAISRNQRLEYFLSVFRKVVSNHPMYISGATKSKTMLERSKALKWFRDKVHAHQRKMSFSDSDFYDFADTYVTDITEMGGVVKTEFSLGVQKRIGFDMWRHLLSNMGRANYDFLFNHSYVVLLSRLSRARDKRAWLPEEEYLATCLAKLARASKHKGLALLAEMAQTPVGPPYAIAGSNFFNKAAAEVMHEMVGTLITLPYFDMLKNLLREQQKRQGAVQ